MKHVLLWAAAAAVTTLSAGAIAGPLATNGYSGSTLVTTDDPNNPIYAGPTQAAPDGFGIVSTPIIAGEFQGFTSFCSGTVIGSRYILTAAHCVDHQIAGQDPNNEYGTTQFRLGGRFATRMTSDDVFVHPYYLNPNVGSDAFGAFGVGDIAIVRLPDGVLPAGTTVHGIYTGSDEFNQTVRHVSFGTTGDGKSGGTTFDLVGRTGLNEYEAVLSPLIGIAGLFDGSLLYDFDSGKKSNDAMSWWFGAGHCATSGVVCNYNIRDESKLDLGFGINEAFIAGGDSGGAALIDGLIAGVHSFGFTSYCANAKAKYGAQGAAYNPDRDCDLNSSFGEMAGDTRVSLYAGWILDILSGGDGSAYANPLGLPDELLSGSNAALAARINAALRSRSTAAIAVDVPEPAALGLFAFGLTGLLAARRRRKA